MKYKENRAEFGIDVKCFLIVRCFMGGYRRG